MNLTQILPELSVCTRESDGYINLTHIATAYQQTTGRRKNVAGWLENKSTQKQLTLISLLLGLPEKRLYEVFQGGNGRGGVWAHPKLLDSFVEFLGKPANSKPSFLYVIGDRERKVCKIGISANPYERLKRLQTGYPWTLDIWLELMIDAPEKVEKILHTRFADFRLNGEWFDAVVFKQLDLNELKEL